MWREYGADGYLVNSFVETVAALHPMFILRAFGGLLYLSGAVIMTANVWLTIVGKLREEAPLRQAAYDPAADRPLVPAQYGATDMTNSTQPLSQEPADVRAVVKGHKRIERNVTLLAVLSFIAVIIGGIVEIAPLFWIDNTIEKVEGMRPYTPLEQ